MILNHDNDIISDPLKILWYGRHHPWSSIWESILMILPNTCFCVIFLTLAVWGIIFYHKDDVFLTSQCLETCFMIIHGMSKECVLHFQKSAINELLTEKRKFWNLSDFNGQILSECQSLLKAGKITIRLFFILASIAASFYLVQPVIAHRLPSQLYVPEGWFTFLAVSYCYALTTMVIAVLGIDTLFWSICFSVTVQFKLVCHKLESIGTRQEQENIDLSEEMSSIVNHHNFLIEFCKKLNKLFSFVFFIQSFITITSLSVAVFILMQSVTWSTRIRCLLYVAADSTDLAFYCIPVEVTINAANDVADSAYASKWYKLESNEFKKYLILVIQRAQTPITFSGFGLIYINIRTLLLVCKTTFSFYTYLSTYGLN